MFYVDKHRPKNLSKMSVHKSLNRKIQNVVSKGDFPNVLLYGPSGAGKKTRVNGLLREVYGGRVENVKIMNKEIKVGKYKKIIVTTLQSCFHIEVNPSDSGSYDRHIVSKLLKEIAQSVPVNVDQKKKKRFKVVVISEADQLSHGAQSSLRRTMEKYIKNCKIVLCCSSLSRILEPIRSRCLCIRVGRPDDKQILGVLNDIAKKENFNLPEKFAMKIAKLSEGNLRRAILMLESSKVKNNQLTDNTEVSKPQWHGYIETIANDILRNQSPKALLELRTKFYNLLMNCVPASLIFKTLLNYLLAKSQDDEFKLNIIKCCSVFETRMVKGTKPIYHLEAFAAKAMVLIGMFQKSNSNKT